MNDPTLASSSSADPGSNHDFGKDIIPHAVAAGQAQAHPFNQSCVSPAEGEAPYWRDVGTIDAYWATNIDLTEITPGAESLRPRLADLDLPAPAALSQVRAERVYHPLDLRRRRYRDRLDDP